MALRYNLEMKVVTLCGSHSPFLKRKTFWDQWAASPRSLGFSSPFNWDRSLFAMMDGTTLPFLPQQFLLSAVAVIVLYSLDFDFIPNVISMLLFDLLCIFYFCLISWYPISILAANLQIGAYVLPPGLLAMALHPLFISK